MKFNYKLYNKVMLKVYKLQEYTIFKIKNLIFNHNHVKYDYPLCIKI